MSDTPRTDRIWGGFLYAKPYLAAAVEETKKIERDLNNSIEPIQMLHDKIAELERDLGEAVSARRAAAETALKENAAKIQLEGIVAELQSQLKEALEVLKEINLEAPDITKQTYFDLAAILKKHEQS